MRNKIITTAIGFFLSVGAVGSLECESMELGQAMILILIGGILLWIGTTGGEEDEDKQRNSSGRKRSSRSDAA